MFNNLTEKFDVIFKKLKGHGKLSEQNIKETMREVRRALLEADVNFKIAKQFIAEVSEQAIGQKVMKSLTPGHQVVKIVHQELINLMGKENFKINQLSASTHKNFVAQALLEGKSVPAEVLADYPELKRHPRRGHLGPRKKCA